VRRAAALVVLVLIAGCSGDPPPPPAAAPTTTPSASPTPTPAATPRPTPAPTPAPPPVNPLTGYRGRVTAPVIVVKVDDTPAGRPQLGVESADVVYVEQVEGGATRLLAVFAGKQPRVVGPVRSVRNNDPEILGPYGRPALAYSGGAAGPVSRLRRSAVIDVSAQRRGAAYRRLGSRPAPYNLVVDVAALARGLRGASPPRDVGFSWSMAVPSGRRVSTVAVTIGKVRQVWRWDARTRRWRLDGRPVSTPNLVVPFSKARLDPTNVDVLGTPSVYTPTRGTGKLLVFRDGRVLGGTWARNGNGARTRYLGADRKPIPLRPGGAWVLLAATGAPVSYR
jgi:hypothetical protein